MFEQYNNKIKTIDLKTFKHIEKYTFWVIALFV